MSFIVLAIFGVLVLIVAIRLFFLLDAWRMWAKETHHAAWDDGDDDARKRIDNRVRRADVEWRSAVEQRDARAEEVNLADRRALMADAQLRKMQRGVERTLKRMAAEREGK